MSQAEIWIEDETLGGTMRVGRLKKVPSQTGDTISFEYDARWLDGRGPVRSFPLDPELSLTAGPTTRAAAPTGSPAPCSISRRTAGASASWIVAKPSRPANKTASREALAHGTTWPA